MPGFDPTKMAIATPTETPSKETQQPAKKRKAKPKPKAAGAVVEELTRRASLTVAAYELLGTIERRVVDTVPSVVVSDAEWRLLLAAGLLESRNAHDLANLLRQERARREYREGLDQLGEREELEHALAEATEAEEAAKKALGHVDLDSLSDDPGLVTRLKDQMKQASRSQREAASRIGQYDNHFSGLMRLAPEPLQQLSKSNQHAVSQSEDAQELSRLEMQSQSLEKLLDVNNASSPLHHVGHSFTNGLLNGLISRYCDPSIVKKIEGGHQLNEGEFNARMAELRTNELPKLQAERDRLRPLVEQANKDAERPLREWVETGVLRIESLIGE